MKNLDKDINYIQMVHFFLEITKVTKKMEKVDFNGIMDKFMMENGETKKNMEVDYGKRKIFPMQVNGKIILFRVLVF